MPNLTSHPRAQLAENPNNSGNPLLVRESLMSGVGYDRIPYCLRYKWAHHDAGRSASRRPKQSNDCTVRAIALARGVPYDDAYDLLAAAGRKCNRGFHFKDWIKHQPWARKIPFPAIKGQPRMNPATFVEQFPVGTYICKVAKHIFVVKDGIVFDTFENRPDRCIYTAWHICQDGQP